MRGGTPEQVADAKAEYVKTIGGRSTGMYPVPEQDTKVLVYDGLHAGRHVVSRVHTRVGVLPPPHVKPVVNVHTGRTVGQRTVVSNVKKAAMDEFMRVKFPHIRSRRGRIRAFEKWHHKRKASKAAAQQQETADVVA